MDLLTAKLALAAAVFAIGWLGGRMVLGGDGGDRGRFLSGGNAFAAGIFLGTGLIHVLGESAAAWRDLGWEYPMAFVLAAAAFSLILLFEHVLLPDEAHAMIHAHTADPTSDEHVHAHGHGHGHSDDPSPYALVVALSAHSVLAGLALGAEQVLASTFMIALAILAHKGTAGLALGIRLARSSMGAGEARRYVLLFALMTPLGILLGLAGSGLLRQRAGLTFDAVVSALAAGTFLYIASIDMLQDEFLRPGSRWAKWLWAVVGLGVTAVLAVWV